VVGALVKTRKQPQQALILHHEQQKGGQEVVGSEDQVPAISFRRSKAVAYQFDSVGGWKLQYGRRGGRRCIPSVFPPDTQGTTSCRMVGEWTVYCKFKIGMDDPITGMC